MTSDNISAPKKEITDALESILKSVVDEGVPGLSAAICKSSGIVWQSSAGFADIADQSLITSKHIFGIGSISKVFVAVVILQLVDRKLLQVLDTVDKFLEEEMYKDIENAGKATIADLLSHTAGVESREDDPRWIVEGRGRDLDVQRTWGKTDALDYIRPQSSLAPGAFSYSNTNFTLLGLIIEKITHQSTESEIRRRILTPLNLEDTFLEGFEELHLQERVPHRYHYASETFRPTAGICPAFTSVQRAQNDLIDASPSNLSIEWVAGVMISSPSDLLRFATALRDGKFFSPSAMEFLQQWQPAAGREGAQIGHGIFQWRSPSGYGTWLGHNGSVLGFTGALWWSSQEEEETDCAVCVLANVGTMHAGKVKSSAPQVVMESRFLKLAKELVNLADELHPLHK